MKKLLAGSYSLRQLNKATVTISNQNTSIHFKSDCKTIFVKKKMVNGSVGFVIIVSGLKIHVWFLLHFKTRIKIGMIIESLSNNTFWNKEQKKCCFLFFQ